MTTITETATVTMTVTVDATTSSPTVGDNSYPTHDSGIPELGCHPPPGHACPAWDGTDSPGSRAHSDPHHRRNAEPRAGEEKHHAAAKDKHHVEGDYSDSEPVYPLPLPQASLQYLTPRAHNDNRRDKVGQGEADIHDHNPEQAAPERPQAAQENSPHIPCPNQTLHKKQSQQPGRNVAHHYDRIAKRDDATTAKKYKDPLTGFSFLGWVDPSGFKFGLMLPLPALSSATAAPSTDKRSTNANLEVPVLMKHNTQNIINDKDAIIQIINPLNKDGGGWGGIVLGESMVGSLMVVVWPSSARPSSSSGTAQARKVLISPRIATSKTASGVGLYKDAKLTFSQIPKGTFVNSSHVVATFICGGCVGANKSFSLSDSSAGGSGGKGSREAGKGESGIFSFAISEMPILDHSDVGKGEDGSQAVVTDHTTRGEPFGQFGVNFTEARSEGFGRLVALAENKNGGDAAGNGSSGGNASTNLQHNQGSGLAGALDGGRGCVCECKCPPCSGSDADTSDGALTGGYIDYKPANMWYGFTKGWFAVLGIMALGYFWGVWSSF